MKKKVDPLKARQAKQKKIAIGGFVLLLALLAVQGPKTLKMLKGPQPVAAPASTTPAATAPGAAPTPATDTGAGAAAPPSGAADLASVADSDPPPVLEQGQLASFERFSSKDPFAQQAQPVPAPTRTSKPRDGTEATPKGGKSGAPSAPTGGKSTSGASAGGFTPAPAAPAAPELATATTIAVNGVAEDVAPEAAFPKDEPTFLLVSIAKNGKSVEIGIAGGEYAGGGETMTLRLGKKLTLQNTADGSRYELELRTVQGFPVPKPKT